MPALSREYRIYLALWRKAIRGDASELVIKCPNRHMAVMMRQGMYRAIKPFRNSIEADSELFRAAEKYVVHLISNEDKYDEHRLVFRERLALGILNEQFDFTEIELLAGDERVMFDKAEAIREKTDPEKVSKRSTPFYEREE